MPPLPPSQRRSHSEPSPDPSPRLRSFGRLGGKEVLACNNRPRCTLGCRADTADALCKFGPNKAHTAMPEIAMPEIANKQGFFSSTRPKHERTRTALGWSKGRSRRGGHGPGSSKGRPSCYAVERVREHDFRRLSACVISAVCGLKGARGSLASACEPTLVHRTKMETHTG